jgi:hypothetical protein
VSYVPLELLPRSKWAQENIAKGRAEGIAQGEAKGIAESVLHILDRRHIKLPAAAREHITTCTDLDRVKAWLDEALTVATYTELTGLDDA